MAKLIFSLSTLALVLPILIPNSGRTLKPAKSDSYEPARRPKTWCVAKPSTNDIVLTANTIFACEQVGFNCEIVKPGKSSFLPDTIISHASVAMNYYYQYKGMNPWNCDFADSGLITTTDPSHGNCSYPYFRSNTWLYSCGYFSF